MIFSFGIQAARGQDDVDVDGIGGRGGDQTSRAFDVRLPQNVRVGGVADQREPAFVGVTRQLGRVAVNDDKRQRFAGQFPRRAAANASGAAEDEVFRQSADLAVHASPAENRL